MEKSKTTRGFSIIRFKDSYSVKCNIQKSSIMGPAHIWIGCEKAEPKVLIPGKGWKELDLPEETAINTRMHLSRKQVLGLLPILIKFVVLGRL